MPIRPSLDTVADLAVNDGDITTTQTTASIFNTTATTLNIGGAATTIAIGAATGTLTLNNPSVRFANGTAAAPSITFAGDTNTGIMWSASDRFSFVAGGGIRATINSGLFVFNPTQIIGWGDDVTDPDIRLYRDAANTLALRNGVNAQIFRAYTSYTDASNYERFAINTAAGAITLAAETAGTGTDDVSLNLIAAGIGGVLVGAGAATARLQVAGNLSKASWTTTGIAFDVAAATFTDTSTAAAGTVAVRTASSFSAPTFASTNAITVTDAFTLYVPKPIAGTNTTITRVNSAYFEGNVVIGTTIATRQLTVSTSTNAQISLENALTGAKWDIGAGTDGAFRIVDNVFGGDRLLIDYNVVTSVSIKTGGVIISGNLIIGATAAGTTAAKTLALTNSATDPTASVDLAHLYAHDISAGNACLALYQETATITTVDNAANRKVPMWVNGALIYMLGTTSAA